MSLTDAAQGVDYRIRPAKHSERKLFCEAFARLDRIRPITDFRYIGMGSIYFVDFILVHRMFGIDDMTSIEGNDDLIDRCKFNVPYDCVTIVERPVDSALPELLAVDQPSVVWLDYDSVLDAARLEEIRLACARLTLPSFFAVSVNVHPPASGQRLAEFRKRFGERDLSRITKESDLNFARLPALMWEYISDAIGDGVRDRADDARYEQVLHIRYRDGAEMLTVGGLLFEGDDIANCGYEALPFARQSAEPYDLRVPKLTYRERKALDQLLPDGDLTAAPPGLASEAEMYAELYRHAPFYVDVEV